MYFFVNTSTHMSPLSRDQDISRKVKSRVLLLQQKLARNVVALTQARAAVHPAPVALAPL